ncbi:MAG: UbiH/UbiF/VisC/COQ6 family ubiquinone biosynthesis hydroxylase [Pseudomonadota bacterium]
MTEKSDLNGSKPIGLRTDVLIVGGGVIGGALGLALAREGLSSIICDPTPVETATAPEFDGRAYAVALASRRMLRALGLWSQIEPDAQEIKDILVSDGRPGEKASGCFLHFDHREIGSEGFGHLVEDRHIRSAVLRAVEKEPLVTYLDGVRVEDWEQTSAWAHAQLSGGERVQARLLVGCDGRASKVAQKAGIDRTTIGYDQVGLVCAVRHEKPHHGVAHEYFLPAGPFAILPLTGNRSSLVWTERADMAETLREASDAVYLAEIRRRFGEFLGQVELDGKRWVYPLNLTVARSFVGPRVALAGDAARGIHPIAGQGMNYGLRDAAALAEVLGDAARLGEDIGSVAVLERYERWRRPDSTAIALATDGINRLFSNDVPIVRAARRFGLWAFGQVGPLRRTAMAFAAGARSDLPRIMLG